MSPFSTASTAGFARLSIFIHHCGFINGSMTSFDFTHSGTYQRGGAISKRLSGVRIPKDVPSSGYPLSSRRGPIWSIRPPHCIVRQISADLGTGRRSCSCISISDSFMRQRASVGGSTYIIPSSVKMLMNSRLWRFPISKSFGSCAGVILTAPVPKSLST